MNAGMNDENFRLLAATTAELGGDDRREPIAVVRCETGWRTLYADGSSHAGRPVCHEVMDELAALVDQYRADAEELRRLALLWDAIERDITDETASATDPTLDPAADAAGDPTDVIAAENRAAAANAARGLDVAMLGDLLFGPAASTGAGAPSSVADEAITDDELDRFLRGLRAS